MELTGNTIFITGGGSGIGRGLAEAFHKLGNKVIISGRKKGKLLEVTAANPGMDFVELDLSDKGSISRAASLVLGNHPDLNTVINNAGIMLLDNAAEPLDEEILLSQIVTNLVGTMRVTSAFIEHLKQQSRATVIYNSSALAFVPLSMFAVYSATKAAIHSYALSQRFMLSSTSVKIQEITPPWVGTGLFGDKDDPNAMPLDKFIDATMQLLGTDAPEIVVEEAKAFRDNPGLNEHGLVNHVNGFMLDMIKKAS